MKLYERFADREFHTSIASSFGIDFDAYESIVLPRLRGAGCRNNIVITDGRMLTHALGGASALPHHAGKLYTVSGATATGVFHPKIFLQAGRRRGRLIVSSANLTAPGLAGNLELASVITCDEMPSGEQQLIAQAWHYLLPFCNDDEQGVSAQLEWMRARARWLDRATPTTGPVGLGDGSLAALLTTGGATGIGQSFIGLIGEPVTRLIVLSPYWDMNLEALEFLAGGLSAGEISIVIDAGCATFPKHGLGRIPGARLYDRGDFRKGRFIHAKMLIAQTQDADHVLLGSANCTAPALGSSTFAGVNEEACLYRRYPAGTVLDALGLTALLAAERRLDPAALPHPVLNEELPFAELTTQNPGRFECRVDTLTWHPSGAYDPAGSSVELLDQQGEPIVCRLLPLQGTGAPRYQISDTEERPAFARVMRRDGKVSAPAIVTLVDRLRAVVRETASRQADSSLRQLDTENLCINMRESRKHRRTSPETKKAISGTSLGMIAGRAADILDEARTTIALRSVHYGKPEQSFSATADLWSAWLKARHGSELRLDPTDIGVMLGLLKIARLAHDPAHRDSALDAAAYLALAQAVARTGPG